MSAPSDLTPPIVPVAPSGWPDLLVQAFRAHSRYLCFVEGGREIVFGSARPAGEGWVHLLPPQHSDADRDARWLNGGLEVRLDKIVWLAEEPAPAPNR